MTDEMKLKSGTFKTSEVEDVSDDAILNDPEMLRQVLTMHALWKQQGRSTKGTQLERIAEKAASRTIEPEVDR